MSLFSFFARSVIKPYTRTYGDLKKTAGNIKTSILEVQQLKERKEQEKQYIDAENAEEAFKKLAQMGGWTEPELRNQARSYRNAKRVLLGLTLISIGLFFGLSLITKSAMLTLMVGLMTSLSTALFGVRTLQFAIFQTQLEERRLQGFREFMGRDDFWNRIFC